jgi:hypothetical protein
MNILREMMKTIILVTLSLLGMTNNAFANPTLSSADSNSGRFEISSTSFNGSYVDIPFSITSKNKVTGLDFQTKFNESKLTFVGIVGKDPTLDSLYYLNPNDRTLRFTANNISGVSPGKTLFSVRFKYNTSNISNSDLIDTKVLLNGSPVTAVIKDSKSIVMTDGSGHKVQIASSTNSITVTSAYAAKLDITVTGGNQLKLSDSLISGQAKTIQLFNFGLNTYTVKVSDGKLSTETLMVIKYLGYTSDFNNDGVTNTQDYLILTANFGQKCALGAVCPTDINGDGVTDIKDFLIFMGNYNKKTCPTDLNKDLMTDVQDYLILIGKFGQKCSPGTECTTDFNRDGVTNVQDYLVLISNFGKKCQ